MAGPLTLILTGSGVQREEFTVQISDLAVFEAVARLGSMSRAAIELHTVQSNVTARVHSLEKELGVGLFSRHSRGAALTDASRRLLPYADKIKVLMAEARSAASDDGTPAGKLALGSLETTAARRLPPVLAAYGLAYPSVEVAMTVGTNTRLIDLVLNHELDGAFVCAPADHPGLISDAVFHEELVLATSESAGEPARVLGSGCTILVKGPGCAYRQRLEHMLARQGVVDVRRLEFGTLEAIIDCVAAGLGITLLPYTVLAGAERAGRIRLHRLPAAEAAVETLFIRRHDAYESSAMRVFLARILPPTGGPVGAPAASRDG
jgi:DNA-binding transcriptional LysR family regulator